MTRMLLPRPRFLWCCFLAPLLLQSNPSAHELYVPELYRRPLRLFVPSDDNHGPPASSPGLEEDETKARVENDTETIEIVDGQQLQIDKNPPKNGLPQLNAVALRAIEGLPGPIYALSAIGPARVGKSFWLGQIAKSLLTSNTGTGTPLESIFAVSDTSESCTEGAWALAVDLANVTNSRQEAQEQVFEIVEEHLPQRLEGTGSTLSTSSTSHHGFEDLQADVSLRNLLPSRGTLLLLDLQGSDKGSETEVALADQLTAILARFSSRSLFFLDRHVEASKLEFFDRVAFTGKALRRDSAFLPATTFVIRHPLRLPKQYTTRVDEFRAVLGTERWDVASSRVLELPEIDVENGTLVLQQARKLMVDLLSGVGGAHDDTLESSLFGGDNAELLPPLRLQEGGLLDGAGFRQMLSQTVEWLQSKERNLDDFFFREASVRTRVCRARFALLEKELEDRVRTGMGLDGPSNPSGSTVDAFSLEDTFLNWCPHDEALRKRAVALVEATRKKLVGGPIWQAVSFIFRAGVFVLIQLPNETASTVRNATFLVSSSILATRERLVFVAGLILLACLYKILSGKSTTQMVRNFSVGALRHSFYGLRCSITCLAPCLLLSNRSFRRVWTPIADEAREWFHTIAERLCTMLLAAQSMSENTGKAAGDLHGLSSKIPLAGGSQTSSTWCGVGSYVLVEFFGSNIDYLLYGLLIAFLWFAVPQLLILVDALLVQRLLLPFVIDPICGSVFGKRFFVHSNRRAGGGGVSTTTSSSISSFNTNVDESDDEELLFDAGPVRHNLEVGVLANGKNVAFGDDGEEVNVSVGYGSRVVCARTLSRVLALLRELVSVPASFTDLIRLHVFDYERRPKVENRKKTWDLSHSEHRSYTEQKIAELLASDAYRLRVEMLKTQQAVPATWGWKAHYARFAKGTAVPATGRADSTNTEATNELLSSSGGSIARSRSKSGRNKKMGRASNAGDKTSRSSRSTACSSQHEEEGEDDHIIDDVSKRIHQIYAMLGTAK
ncbi:unnamed protein product [Amoebophrya sp. A25]|nr:unnamed protein product [Amoebophrya sp. A25]|eukprot:GSA25T00026926001.1